MTDASPEPGAPHNHRTVDRAMRILEETVYHPGITFAELARALDAPKSSVHVLVRGLLANGWLYADGKNLYVGPAMYGLTLAAGQIQVGRVTQDDLQRLHELTGATVSLGVEVGDHLIHVRIAGATPQSGFDARNNIRRNLLTTAGGKALLAARTAAERNAFLRRHRDDEAEAVATFLNELEEIQESGYAQNYKYSGSQFAIAAAVRNQFGEVAGEVTMYGRTTDLLPQRQFLVDTLLLFVAGQSSDDRST